MLGEGAGVFVEYLTGGQWRIWTSCDTAVSGTGCQFEIRAVAGGRIDGVTAFDTELDDAVELYGADTAVFLAYTEMASDEVEILTEAGDSLMLEVVLDGIVAPEYLVWYGSGYKHTGAATSPVVFEPDRP